MVGGGGSDQTVGFLVEWSFNEHLKLKMMV